jgi:hypothetical protein
MTAAHQAFVPNTLWGEHASPIPAHCPNPSQQLPIPVALRFQRNIVLPHTHKAGHWTEAKLAGFYSGRSAPNVIDEPSMGIVCRVLTVTALPHHGEQLDAVSERRSVLPTAHAVNASR